MNRLKQINNHLSMGSTSIFFGSDCLNRVSFLRTDDAFIESALKNENTKFVLFNNGNPIGDDSIKYFPSNEIGTEIINELAESNNSKRSISLNINFVFLGLNEDENGFTYKNYKGCPYFAINSTNLPQFNQLHTLNSRNLIFDLSLFDSSIFSYSKMYLDWLNRYRFCAGCGSRVIQIQAGTKLLCTSTENCPVKSALVSNISFPRTDSVIITAIVNEKFDKILLGKGKRFIKPMYSCIAGFIEPSETIENAAKREIWEETGLICSHVKILKSQPWPYPSNLMIGCIGYIKENGVNEVINLGHDPELDDAKWFNISDIKDKILTNSKSDWELPTSKSISFDLIDYVVKKYDELN